LPVSHVLLSLDPSQVPFLNEITMFAAKDWSYPPVAQSYSAFEKAAAAVASCLSLATQTGSVIVTEEQADVAGGSGKSEIETMMHKAEATLMQALAPARVKIGPAITAYLNQLHNVTTLCLPNSIPADADSTTGNLNGQPLRALCTRLTSHTLTRSPSAIARLSNLTDLNLDYNPVCLLGEAAASALVTCLSALSRIQRLSLCGSCLSVSCFEQLHSQVFKALSGLVDLRLSFNFELGRSEFTRTLPRDLPRLRVLKLASVMMSAEDTTAVITCAVECCSQLKTLDVTSNGSPPFQVVYKAQDKIEQLLFGVVLQVGATRVELRADHVNPKAVAVKFDMDKLRNAHSSTRAHLEQVHKIHPSCEALVLDGTQHHMTYFLPKNLWLPLLSPPPVPYAPPLHPGAAQHGHWPGAQPCRCSTPDAAQQSHALRLLRELCRHGGLVLNLQSIGSRAQPAAPRPRLQLPQR